MLSRSFPYPIQAFPRLGNPVGHNNFAQSLAYAQIFTGAYGVSIASALDGVKGTLGSTIVWTGPFMNTAGASTAVVNYGAQMPLTVNLAQGAFSIFARVYLNAAGVIGGIARRNDGNTVNAGWEVFCSGQGTCLTFVRATTDFNAATSTSIATERWVNVVIIYPGTLVASDVKIYYDGILKTLTTTANGSGAQGSDAPQSFIVGEANFLQAGFSSGNFQGRIDSMYIWRRILRTEEVLALNVDPYAPFNIFSPRLQFYVDAAVASLRSMPE